MKVRVWLVIALFFGTSTNCLAFTQNPFLSTGTGQNICSLPPATGRCRAAFPSWFYDPIDQDCKRFTYGGCGGNENRFESKEECQFRCPIDCTLSADSGPCQKMEKKYFFDLLVGECREFAYGGCGGNANKFSSFGDCQKYCRLH